MAKTKISEFSATPANNTDIDSINIAEGCAPSGINDAIRELMAQLKDFQTGAVGDSFNGPIGTTTAAAGAFTTLSSTGNTTLGDASGDAVTVNGTATFANANPTLTAGTANGVTYLNGSKVLTSGSALTFDGSALTVEAHVNVNGGDIRFDDDRYVYSYSGGSVGQYRSGFYLDGAGTNIRHYINNAEQMRLTSTGLGIGTSSPTTKLTISGLTASSFTDGISLTNSQNWGWGSSLTFRTVLTSGGAVGDAARITQGYDSSNNYHLSFSTTGSGTLTERMRLDSAGNLGLGVTPSAWGNNWRVVDQLIIGSMAASTSGVGDYGPVFNAYNDNTNWRYKYTGGASMRYRLNESGHAWFTAPSGTAGNAISFTQAMTLDASGNLQLGTTTSKTGTIGGTGTGMTIGGSGTPNLAVYNTTNASYVLSLGVGSDGTAYLYNNANTSLVFSTNTTERARIDSSGNLLVGTTNTNPVGADINGFAVLPGGRTTISRMGGEVLGINRGTDDGVLMSFAQAGSTEGNISVSGTTVSYNGGHLARYAQTTTAKDNSLVKGTVLSNLDEMNVYTKDGHPVENEQLNKVKVSDTEGDVNVAGVFVNWSHDEDHNVDEINMAMTGDMIIRIAQGVTVVRGDLLMSAGDGTAKPQGDDIIRSKTVAKVTSNHVTCTYADGSYCVPCVLMAC